MLPSQRSRVRALTAMVAGGALALGGMVAGSAPTATAATATSADTARHTARHAPQATPFAFQASGFGTTIRGGRLPAGSDSTARAVIACTNRTGIEHANHEARTRLPGLGTLYGVHSSTRTAQHGDVVASYARHSIAALRLIDSRLGRLTVRGLVSTSRAFHDSSGFHARTSTHVASIRLALPGGIHRNLRVPTAHRPLVVPGLAKISLGYEDRRANADGAKAIARTLRVHVIPTNTVALIGNSYANLASGVRSGVFSGSSSGTDLKALRNLVSSGRTPVALMPCQGTAGEIERQSLAHLDLGHRVYAYGLNAVQFADQTAATARGYEEGRITRLSLGGGDVIIRGIVGRAFVLLGDDGLTRSSRGTTVGKVLVNGEERAFPRTDTLVIPHIVKLQRSVVERSAHGVSVTALRLTLLDGSGAVLNLGRANLSVKDAGL